MSRREQAANILGISSTLRDPGESSGDHQLVEMMSTDSQHPHFGTTKPILSEFFPFLNSQPANAHELVKYLHFPEIMYEAG